MTKIQRYSFAIIPEFELSIPKDSRIASIQLHNGVPTLWMHSRPENEKVQVKFYCFSTDANIPEGLCYVGTIQVGGGMMAWHIFMLEALVPSRA